MPVRVSLRRKKFTTGGIPLVVKSLHGSLRLAFTAVNLHAARAEQPSAFLTCICVFIFVLAVFASGSSALWGRPWSLLSSIPASPSIALFPPPLLDAPAPAASCCRDFALTL
eukprot:7936839-Pyramimonas_sp.AAC.1